LKYLLTLLIPSFYRSIPPVGRAQLLFSFPFFDRAQREASLANLVLKSLPSFLSKPEASLVDPAPAALSNAVTSITLILNKSMPVH
jgi:hypothetical protein